MPNYNFDINNQIRATSSRSIQQEIPLPLIEGLPDLNAFDIIQPSVVTGNNDLYAELRFVGTALHDVVSGSRNKKNLLIKMQLLRDLAPPSYESFTTSNISALVNNGNYFNPLNNTYNIDVYNQVFNSYDEAFDLGYIKYEDYFDYVKQSNFDISIVITNATPSGILSSDKVAFTQVIHYPEFYNDLFITLIGKDSSDSTQPGLAANEYYKAYVFNGETYQELTLTYNLGISGSNAGKFIHQAQYAVESVTLGNQLNNI